MIDVIGSEASCIRIYVVHVQCDQRNMREKRSKTKRRLLIRIYVKLIHDIKYVSYIVVHTR